MATILIGIVDSATAFNGTQSEVDSKRHYERGKNSHLRALQTGLHVLVSRAFSSSKFARIFYYHTVHQGNGCARASKLSFQQISFRDPHRVILYFYYLTNYSGEKPIYA